MGLDLLDLNDKSTEGRSFVWWARLIPFYGGWTGAERGDRSRPARTGDLFFKAGEIVSPLPTGWLKAFRPAQKNDPQIPQPLAREDGMVPSSLLRESTESGDQFPSFRVFAPSRKPLPSRQGAGCLSHAKPLRREGISGSGPPTLSPLPSSLVPLPRPSSP